MMTVMNDTQEINAFDRLERELTYLQQMDPKYRAYYLVHKNVGGTQRMWMLINDFDQHEIVLGTHANRALQIMLNLVGGV